MFVIGITGGIGSGKSFVAHYCSAYGIPVIDADEISRETTGPGGSAIKEIQAEFGYAMIDENGGLNRAKISQLVFNDKKALDRLSTIVHKYVVEKMVSKVDQYNKQKQKVLILDVPIPVKNGFLDLCDQVWVIWANDDIRVNRLIQRGMTEEESKRRIKCQMNREEYESIADFIIDNNSTPAELEESVRIILERELKLRGIKYQQP
jgi:dephospho-CoA kinase